MARNAYDAQDVDLSRQAHSFRDQLIVKDEGHAKLSSPGFRALLKGSFLGLNISVFSTSLLEGMQKSSEDQMRIGISTGLVLSIIFFVVELVTSFSSLWYKLKEKRREKWELDNYPEGELQEMVELYMKSGISHDDASEIIKRMSKYPRFFVDHMLVQELGMLPPKDPSELLFQLIHLPIGSLVFAIIPPLIYKISVPISRLWAFVIVLAVCILFAGGIGFVHGKVFQWRTRAVWNSAAFVIQLLLCAGMSYGIGAAFR